MRLLLLVALFLPLAGVALAARTESVHSLRTAEAAFYKAGLPFHADLTPNRYLVRPLDPFALGVPKALRHNLLGWAGAPDQSKYTTWQVFDFDGPAPAASFANFQLRASRASSHSLILRANNVVYVGSNLRATSRAMAQLRQQ